MTRERCACLLLDFHASSQAGGVFSGIFGCFEVERAASEMLQIITFLILVVTQLFQLLLCNVDTCLIF